MKKLTFLVCCVALGAIVLLRFASRQPPHERDVLLETETEVLADGNDSERPRDEANAGVESTERRDESRVLNGGETHEPGELVKVEGGAEPGAESRLIQTAARSEADAGPSQQAQGGAEAWSYPPPLQLSASNNYVRAMERLDNARSDTDRYFALGPASKSAVIYGEIEDARKFATELLSRDEQFKGEPWRDGGAVHEGNFVLGRIAAMEGRIEEARQHLLEAGKSTGSPVLGSFGPNMSLARDLLQAGERDAVLDYFELCRKFWNMGHEKLTLWSEDVRAGRMPDFGANLFY